MIKPHSDVLSVIIVNRNTADLLQECFRHILESEIDRKIEITVVDNGSSDGSVDVVKKSFPETRVIEAGRNLGFARANNLGFAQTRGDFILLVNTDAMLDRECASKLLKTMESNPYIGMVGPQLLNADGSRQTSFESTPGLISEIVGRGVMKVMFPERHPGKNVQLKGPTEVETLIGAVMLIRRAAWIAVDGFDEGFFFFFEETDLALRMRKSGWFVYHDPDAKAVHLQGATAGQYKAAPRIEYYRSRYLFIRKNYGAVGEFILKIFLTANLTLNVIALGLASLFCLGKSGRINDRVRQRAALWRWHMNGLPSDAGLPRD